MHEIFEEICPQAEDWEYLREISYLNVDAEVMYRPFKTLSNGEQTKVLLAALFLNEGQFLLIDEPTNHLDTDARKMVSDYLRKKKGFILISHDRIFLDGCVDHILSINREFQSNELIVLADLSVKYDDHVVNKPISFKVEQGDRIVLDGKNGSGKSSILKLILGNPIAKSLCEKAHLYIWDEPLNFIDIYSRMQIEELIQRFNPTMVIVEHDQVFQQTVATKTISM